MGIPYNTALPPDLRALKQEIEGYARGYGLDFYETIFEVLGVENFEDGLVKIEPIAARIALDLLFQGSQIGRQGGVVRYSHTTIIP